MALRDFLSNRIVQQLFKSHCYASGEQLICSPGTTKVKKKKCSDLHACPIINLLFVFEIIYTCIHLCPIALVCSPVCHVCECTGGYEGLWPLSSFSFCVSVSRISFLPAPPLLLHCALLPLHIELAAEAHGPLHTTRGYARASVSDQSLEDSI